MQNLFESDMRFSGLFYEDDSPESDAGDSDDERKTVYTDTGSEESPHEAQEAGDDLYIIPMNNIKFEDDDD